MLLNTELCIVFSLRERETTVRASHLAQGALLRENAVAHVKISGCFLRFSCKERVAWDGRRWFLHVRGAELCHIVYSGKADFTNSGDSPSEARPSQFVYSCRGRSLKI